MCRKAGKPRISITMIVQPDDEETLTGLQSNGNNAELVSIHEYNFVLS